jgi:hypothetical protein
MSSGFPNYKYQIGIKIVLDDKSVEQVNTHKKLAHNINLNT